MTQHIKTVDTKTCAKIRGASLQSLVSEVSSGWTFCFLCHTLIKAKLVSRPVHIANVASRRRVSDKTVRVKGLFRRNVCSISLSPGPFAVRSAKFSHSRRKLWILGYHTVSLKGCLLLQCETALPAGKPTSKEHRWVLLVPVLRLHHSYIYLRSYTSPTSPILSPRSGNFNTISHEFRYYPGTRNWPSSFGILSAAHFRRLPQCCEENFCIFAASPVRNFIAPLFNQILAKVSAPMVCPRQKYI